MRSTDRALLPASCGPAISSGVFCLLSSSSASFLSYRSLSFSGVCPISGPSDLIHAAPRTREGGCPTPNWEPFYSDVYLSVLDGVQLTGLMDDECRPWRGVGEPGLFFFSFPRLGSGPFVRGPGGVCFFIRASIAYYWRWHAGEHLDEFPFLFLSFVSGWIVLLHYLLSSFFFIIILIVLDVCCSDTFLAACAGLDERESVYVCTL
ncbi:hypothetical protein BO70DRAFT_182356 [Aspergillus heteromorphus CBS 117.55]|uniref:Uncharacterized protein n=1 Tax=Aspergillus heteromorphus CBS 117.55 TaxID=1448321 RepID=A0A317WQX0_9EURO|nr:uncharacterized protein BO70DRAFT_182356 [Aspergillus heteromorphus CBS 117.55]PWY88455.1 hypothetical protein BO70DRAFT_182356 [Aspergillus heteromorphus CBS 117.55]